MMTTNTAKPLRVLLVSPSGDYGGAEQVFLSLAKHFPRWNVEPVLACLRPGPFQERASAQGLAVHVFREHRYREPHQVAQAWRWLARLARELKVDVLHSNHTAHLYASPAAWFARIPEVWHIHDYPHHEDSVQRFCRRLGSSHVIFTTQHVASGHPELHRRPFSLIPPVCVEPDRLRRIPTLSDIREHLGLPEGPLLLTVARLQEHKGHRHLLDAVPHVLRAYPNAVFAVVGKAGDPEQEAYARELSAHCARLVITERVHFLGFVGDADLVALYREAAALVHPAVTEGFGLTLLEAMALGAPVIAADAEGPRELITDRETGLLVPRGDVEALAEAIIALLKNPLFALQLQQAGRRHADSFQVENMVRQTVAVYQQVVPRPASALSAEASAI